MPTIIEKSKLIPILLNKIILKNMITSNLVNIAKS